MTCAKTEREHGSSESMGYFGDCLWVSFKRIQNIGGSVQLLSHVRLFVTPWIAACQASLSITNSQSLLKLMSIESVMPSNYLIFCHPLLLLPSVFPSIRVFSKESVICIRWPKYCIICIQKKMYYILCIQIFVYKVLYTSYSIL